MNNPFAATFAIVAFLTIGIMAWAQQPPAKSPTPTSPPTPAAPPPATLNKQAVQMTPEEQRQMDDAWKDIKIANLGLQVAMESIRIAHPGWKYDLQQQVFYVDVAPVPAGAAPAKPVTAAPPAAAAK